MGELSRFEGMYVFYYSDDHEPPHLHVEYDGKESKIAIDGTVILNNLPSKKLGILLEWMTMHKDELYANWERRHGVNMNKPINAIYIGEYKLLIEFSNKEIRIADLNYLHEKDLPDFPEMKNEEYIRSFEFDRLWGLFWPNGYDIAPDFIYDISRPVRIEAVA